MTKTILVTGATGHVGGAVVEALAAGGFKVRAATRNPENFQNVPNVTPVKLDYHDPATIGPALAGAQGLFLIALPLDFEAPQVLAPIIAQAGKAGIEQIVLHSALGVDQVEKAPLRQVERQLMAGGVPYTIVRSIFFMDNFVSGSIAPMINEVDGIFLPAGTGRTSFVATRDIAAVVATAFSQGLVGKEYDLTGPEALDHYQVAEIIGEIAGRQITYQPLEEFDFLEMVRKRGMPEAAARYLAMLYKGVREGKMARLTNDVQLVTGRIPMGFADFAAENAAVWRKEEVSIPVAARTVIGAPGVHLSH